MGTSPFSSGSSVQPVPLESFSGQHRALGYAVNGIPLPTQPYLATAPIPGGSLIATGVRFILFFANPDSLTQTLLTNGAVVTLQFLLTDGRAPSATALLVSSWNSPLLLVEVQVLSNADISAATLPFSSSQQDGSPMTSNVFGTLPTDTNKEPVLGVYDPVTHSIIAAQAGTTTTDSTNGVVYAPVQMTGKESAITGTVSLDGDTVVIPLTGGQANVLVQSVTTTLSGTLLFEASPDSGTTYYPLLASQEGTSPTVIASSVVGTGGSQAAGVWRANVSGFTNFRVRLHPATSGIATITLRLSQGAQNVTVNNSSLLGPTASVNSAPVVPATDYVSPIKSVRTEIIGNAPGVVNAISTDLIPSTDVTGYTCAVLQLTGTWSMTLQPAQCNNNTNFLSVQSIGAQTFLTNTGVLNSISANGLYVIPLTGRYLRIQPTAWSSNASCVATLELYTTPPPFVVAAMGTYVTLTAVTSNVNTQFHLVSAATTNATNIKASLGQVYSWNIENTNAAYRYLKFHNTASTPTPGSGVVRTVGVPPNGIHVFHTTIGLSFSSGIGITTVTLPADNDTTAVGLSDLLIDIDFR